MFRNTLLPEFDNINFNCLTQPFLCTHLWFHRSEYAYSCMINISWMFTNIFYSHINMQILLIYSIIVHRLHEMANDSPWINILINQVLKSSSSTYYKPIFVKESLPIRFGYTDNGSLHIFHTLISFAPSFYICYIIFVTSYLTSNL